MSLDRADPACDPTMGNPWSPAVLAELAQCAPAALPATAARALAALAPAAGFVRVEVVGMEKSCPWLAWPKALISARPAEEVAQLTVPFACDGQPAGEVRFFWPEPADSRPDTALRQRLATLAAGIGALLARGRAGVDPDSRSPLGAAGPIPTGDPKDLLTICRDVVMRTADLVVVTDADQRIRWVNPAFEALTGWTLAQARGHRPGRLLHNEDTDPETLARIRRALRSGQGVRAEVLNHARDGRPYWLDIDIQPLHAADGTLGGFVSVQCDITERIAQQQRLAEAERRAAAAHDRVANAVAALPDPVALFDAEHRLVIANAPWQQLYAPSGAPLPPGTPIEDVLRARIPPDAPPRDGRGAACRGPRRPLLPPRPA